MAPPYPVDRIRHTAARWCDMVRRPFRTELFGKLLSFLSAEEAALGSATPGRPAQAAPARPTATVVDRMRGYESRLTATVSEQGSAVSGRMQLVNLSKIAERFGPRWPQVSKKVHYIIESILARRLSSGDQYVRQGDDHYYFLFSGLSESEARIKCTLLTQEITAKLMGDEAGMAELAGLDLRSVVARVDDIESPATAPLKAIDQVLSRKQAEEVRADRDAPEPVDRNTLPKAQLKSLIAILETVERDLKQWHQMTLPAARHGNIVARLEGVAQLLRQAEHAFAEMAAAIPTPDQDAAGAPASPTATAEPGWQATHAEPTRPDGGPVWTETEAGRPTEPFPTMGISEKAAMAARADPKWQVFRVLPKLIERTLVKIETELKHQAELLALDIPSAVAATASAPEPALPEPPPFDWSEAEVIFSYLPMWQVSKKAINSYLCQLALKANEQIHPIEAMFDDEIDESVIAALDRLVLRKVLQDIHILLRSEHRNIVVVPVHFSTLVSSRARREYLGVCTLVRPEHQPYLVWELIYPHIGISNGPVQQAASVLKPHARAILLRVDLDYPQFDDLAPAGVYAVGTDLADRTQSEAELIHKLEIFKTRAERSGLKAYLHGARSLSLATAAVCAGFDHIDGGIIAPPIDNPEGIQTYRIESVYAHVFGADGI